MSLSTNMIDYATDTAGNGTTADVSTQPADNCHTIIVYNTDGTNSALVGIVDVATNLTTSNSATLIAGASLSMKIGTQEFRPCGNLNDGTATQVLRLEGVAATPVVSFQFINSTGSVPP